MQDVLIAILLGGASGLMGVVAYRFGLAWLGWLTLAPLAWAVYLYGPVPAGLAGSVCGALLYGVNRQVSIPGIVPHARLIEAFNTTWLAVSWGIVFALAAFVWPDGTPAWGAVIMPAAAMGLSLTYGRFLSPFYWSWFLGSQDGALPVVHIARLGSDLNIPAVLALTATVPVILLVQLPPSGATIITAIAALLVVGAAVVFGLVSYRGAVTRLDAWETARVAAVAVSPLEFDEKSPAYSDIDAAIARYKPHVARAIAQGAELIVLPEYTVEVTPQNRERWLAAVAGWAAEGHVRIVAGLGCADPHQDQLVIADHTGRIAVVYDKQHPAPGLEPKPQRRTPPAHLEGDPFPVSAVVCVDMDYADVARPVAGTGGVLAVPANDWPEIVEMHHRSTVWNTVMAGVAVVRSAGHGISAVYDAAGRVVAQANSLDGPVVLVADVPVRTRGARRMAEIRERVEPLTSAEPAAVGAGDGTPAIVSGSTAGSRN